MSYTGDDLLSSVKTTCTTPSNQVLMDDSRLFDFANREIKARLVPDIRNINEEFFVALALVPLIAGQDNYSLPYRTVGRTLRDLKITDGAQTRDIAQIAI